MLDLQQGLFGTLKDTSLTCGKYPCMHAIKFFHHQNLLQVHKHVPSRCSLEVTNLRLLFASGPTQPDADAAYRFPRGADSTSRNFSETGKLQLAAGSFTLVCMQPDCNIPHVCASAYAIRYVGGWAGSIHVITDNPMNLGHACQVRAAGSHDP